MTNPATNLAYAIARQECRDAFLLWRMASDAYEPALWKAYQQACVEFRTVTGREFAPVLWAVQS